MAALIQNTQKMFELYKQWVNKNPQFTGECETAAKLLSYLIVGRVNNSQAITEFILCSSNLLTLLNDRIINEARCLQASKSGDTLKIWLTVIHHCEVFLEISIQKLWKTPGKWCIIVCIQLFKCVARLVLLHYHREHIIETPPISNLDRSKLRCIEEDLNAQQQLDSFQLPSSGRTVRSVGASPALHLRTWKPIVVGGNHCAVSEPINNCHPLAAETVYVIKPLAQLAFAGYYGHGTWPPWLISLAMDLTAMQLYKLLVLNAPVNYSAAQKAQLSRRTILLLLYLLRSPMYDRFCETKLKTWLKAISSNVALARLICEPILHYLPFWQCNYSYMWSS